MTNFEWIKSLSPEQLAEWLENEVTFTDEAPWNKWFNEQYCKKCPPEKGMIDFGHGPEEEEFAFCELGPDKKCRYFDHILDCEEICKLWLDKDKDEV